MTLSADGAVLGARIRTLDPRRPHATALAWRDGRLVAVGEDAEVREHVGARTDVIDGAGLSVVPGLVDTRSPTPSATARSAERSTPTRRPAHRCAASTGSSTSRR